MIELQWAAIKRIHPLAKSKIKKKQFHLIFMELNYKTNF